MLFQITYFNLSTVAMAYYRRVCSRIGMDVDIIGTIETKKLNRYGAHHIQRLQKDVTNLRLGSSTKKKKVIWKVGVYRDMDNKGFQGNNRQDKNLWELRCEKRMV